jgi:sugar lactone lactonase YvrE
MTSGLARLAVELPAEHGEGPVWDSVHECLLWVDLTEGKLHSFHPATSAVETRTFDEPVCAVAPHADGRLLVAFAKRIAWVDWNSGAITATVCQIEPDLPANRANDGKLDPAGRFWIGTMSNDGSVEGAGALYRLDGNTLTRVLDRLTIANGLGWTADTRNMFFIDSPTREVWAFDFDPSNSSIRNRRTVVRVPEEFGLPDGMTVASDDTIWVAHWGPGCVCRWDPSTGALLEQINTGCPHTTSCCLAPDGTFFITTSRLGLDESALASAPLSGALFIHP